MEAWPAQPANTQSVNRQKVGGRRSRPPRVNEGTNNRAAVSGSCSRGCADTQRLKRRGAAIPVDYPRQQQRNISLRPRMQLGMQPDEEPCACTPDVASPRGRRRAKRVLSVSLMSIKIAVSHARRGTGTRHSRAPREISGLRTR